MSGPSGRFGRGSEIAAGNVEGPLRTVFTGYEHIHQVIDENRHPGLVRPRGAVSALVGGR
ncbi:hypothetical protein [Amycolatopsis sp. MtRt-6]|uniref:hypothetical protein n=1 Tax=Amycolatopsis sp. MtRt-6 TaxID=2792782 RepID=UPI001F5E10D1|nr:hypothetical protein [Amycolatopsis sp. MtRt-6]